MPKHGDSVIPNGVKDCVLMNLRRCAPLYAVRGHDPA